ncbi:MAG: hypothetical protein ACI9ZF_003049 [Bradyrhizobium sp.]
MSPVREKDIKFGLSAHLYVSKERCNERRQRQLAAACKASPMTTTSSGVEKLSERK